MPGADALIPVLRGKFMDAATWIEMRSTLHSAEDLGAGRSYFLNEMAGSTVASLRIFFIADGLPKPRFACVHELFIGEVILKLHRQTFPLE